MFYKNKIRLIPILILFAFFQVYPVLSSASALRTWQKIKTKFTGTMNTTAQKIHDFAMDTYNLVAGKRKEANNLKKFDGVLNKTEYACANHLYNGASNDFTSKRKAITVKRNMPDLNLSNLNIKNI